MCIGLWSSITGMPASTNLSIKYERGREIWVTQHNLHLRLLGVRVDDELGTKSAKSFLFVVKTTHTIGEGQEKVRRVRREWARREWGGGGCPSGSSGPESGRGDNAKREAYLLNVRALVGASVVIRDNTHANTTLVSLCHKVGQVVECNCKHADIQRLCGCVQAEQHLG